MWNGGLWGVREQRCAGKGDECVVTHCVRSSSFSSWSNKTSAAQNGKGILGVCPAAMPKSTRHREVPRHVCSMRPTRACPPCCRQKKRRACNTTREACCLDRPRQEESMPVWCVSECCGLVNAVRRMSGRGSFSPRLHVRPLLTRW